MCIERIKKLFKRITKQDFEKNENLSISHSQKSKGNEVKKLVQIEDNKKKVCNNDHPTIKLHIESSKFINSNSRKQVGVSKTYNTIKIDKKPPKLENYYEPSLYIGNNHWKLFSSLFNQAVSEIKIITGSISYKALSLLLTYVQKEVKVKILTGRGRNYGRIFQMLNVQQESVKRCQSLHAKICIIDDKTMIIGSSNITKGSLGDYKGHSGNLEADILIKDKDMINSASILFEILWKEKKNIDLLQNDSGFISSAFGIPLKLKNLILEAKEEIVIIVPPFFQKSMNLKSIPKYIRELNPKVRLKIIIPHRIGESNIDGLEELQKFHKTEVILVKDNLHCKIYMFDEKIAIISSLNLYLRAWIRNLESGVITKDENTINKIKEWIYHLEMNQAPIHIVKTSDGGNNGGIVEDFIEKIYFRFKTEGNLLIPELRLEILNELGLKKEKLESLKPNKSHEIKTKISLKIKTPKIEILPEIFGAYELTEKKRVVLIVERSKLFLKLDEYYSKLKEIYESKKILYDYAIQDKKRRDNFNSQVQVYKNEREKLLEKIRGIKVEKKETKNKNRIEFLKNELIKIKHQVNKLWNEQSKLVEQSQNYHEEYTLKLKEIRNIKNLKNKYKNSIKRIKERINKINIKLIKLKRTEEISDLDQEVIIEDLFNYLIACPYKSKHEIKWYFVDFAIDYRIYLDINLLFKVFHLAFKTKNPIRTAGHFFKLISIISKVFEKRFMQTVHKFFKNMILSRGGSGLEIKDKHQFVKYKNIFLESFGFPAPDSEKIIESIIKHKKSLNRVINEDIYFKRILNIFQDNESETLVKLVKIVKKKKKKRFS